MGFFSHTTSEHIQKLTTDDIEEIEDAIAHMIPEMTATLIPPLIIMGVMFMTDWSLALTVMMGIFVAFYIMKHGIKKSQNSTGHFLATKAKMGRLSTELLSMLPMVKILNQSDTALKQVHRSTAEYTQGVQQWIADTGIYTKWFHIVASSHIVFLLPMLIVQYYVGWVSLQTAVLFVMLSAYMNTIALKYYNVTHRFAHQFYIFNRINMFLAQPEIPYKTTTAIAIEKYDIQIENVCFSYDDTPVLQHINLKIPQGTSLALVGKSGAGKIDSCPIVA